MIELTEYFIKDLDNISTDHRHTTKLLHEAEKNDDEKRFINFWMFPDIFDIVTFSGGGVSQVLQVITNDFHLLFRVKFWPKSP